jgi:Domain of unknown function (DUF3291)
MAAPEATVGGPTVVAESSPGFVWRLQTEEGDATALRPLGEDTLVSVSVWRAEAGAAGRER